MAKTKDRLLGEMPEWARTGPIDLRNYNFRAEKHCAERSKARGGEHPTISRTGAEFLAWHQYFDTHLRGRPWAFKSLLDAAMAAMTVPEPMPQWFDPSFTPDPKWRPGDALPQDRFEGFR